MRQPAARAGGDHRSVSRRGGAGGPNRRHVLHAGRRRRGRIRRAVEATLAAYPSLRIVGRRNGYFSRAEEAALVAQIARLKPDVLWLSLGVPLEQQFCRRNLSALRGVGIVKTSGGLFDFLSSAKPRAPAGCAEERSRMAVQIGARALAPVRRYLVTNPHALFVMVTNLK